MVLSSIFKEIFAEHFPVLFGVDGEEEFDEIVGILDIFTGVQFEFEFGVQFLGVFGFWVLVFDGWELEVELFLVLVFEDVAVGEGVLEFADFLEVEDFVGDTLVGDGEGDVLADFDEFLAGFGVPVDGFFVGFLGFGVVVAVHFQLCAEISLYFDDVFETVFENP